MSYRLRYSLSMCLQDPHLQGLISRIRAGLSHGQKIALLLGVNTTTRHFFLAGLIAVSLASPALAAGGTNGGNNGGNDNKSDKNDKKSNRNWNIPDKVDKALAGQLKAGTEKNKVIITVQSGYRGSIRKALELRGERIKREHGSLNVFVAELDSATVMELAKNPLVKSVALDGPMNASQLGLGLIAPAVTVSSARRRNQPQRARRAGESS